MYDKEKQPKELTLLCKTRSQHIKFNYQNQTH